MAISNPVKNASGNWVVTIGQDGSAASKTLSTKNTYVDGDIILNESAATQIVFGNQPASGKQASSYTTIDDEAPVLISGDYLYVNEGYRGDVKISLSKLVPDGSDVAGHGDYILKGHSAYDNAGTLVAGTIETREPSSTYYSSSDTGYGLIEQGYIPNTRISIIAGDLNPTATVATQDTAISGASSIDKQYVKITPKDIPTTAGWVTKDGETGTVLNYKVKDGSATPSATLSGATGLTSPIDVQSKQFTVTPTASVGTAGWISSIANGTAQNYEVISAQLSGTGSVSTTSSNVTLAESSTAPTSGFYVTSTGGGTVNVSQPGWINDDTSGGTATKYYSLPTSTMSSTGSVTTAPDVAVSGAATGMATSSTATSYYVTVTGTPSNGAVQTKYTAAEGYTSGATDVADGTVTVTPTATGSGTKIYIKASTLTIGSSSTFDPVVAPGTVSVARQAKPSGDTWTDAASGSATGTKPTSGVYVQVAGTAAANTTGVAVSGTVTAETTDGYKTAETKNYSVSGTATTSAKTGGAYYVPITAGSASVVDKSQTISSDMTISGAITTSGSATVYRVTSAINKEYSGVLTGSVSTAGWIASVASANLGVVGSKSLDIAVYGGEVV